MMLFEGSLPDMGRITLVATFDKLILTVQGDDDNARSCTMMRPARELKPGDTVARWKDGPQVTVLIVDGDAVGIRWLDEGIHEWVHRSNLAIVNPDRSD